MQQEHTCGYPIWVDEIFNGISFRPIFLDGKEDSPTAGQRVFECPQCGEHILKRDFDSQSLHATV